MGYCEWRGEKRNMPQTNFSRRLKEERGTVEELTHSFHSEIKLGRTALNFFCQSGIAISCSLISLSTRKHKGLGSKALSPKGCEQYSFFLRNTIDVRAHMNVYLSKCGYFDDADNNAGSNIGNEGIKIFNLNSSKVRLVRPEFTPQIRLR